MVSLIFCVLSLSWSRIDSPRYGHHLQIVRHCCQQWTLYRYSNRGVFCTALYCRDLLLDKEDSVCYYWLAIQCMLFWPFWHKLRRWVFSQDWNRPWTRSLRQWRWSRMTCTTSHPLPQNITSQITTTTQVGCVLTLKLNLWCRNMM